MHLTVDNLSKNNGYNASFKGSSYFSGELKDQSRGATVMEVLLSKITANIQKTKELPGAGSDECHSPVTHFCP